ncbi:hypothetical protein HA402_010471 [Bradysia odoriphaga]|nr:hypothetical protein HA402_010471 [Bradysia odoriphaga]
MSVHNNRNLQFPKSNFYDEEGVLNLIDGLTNFCVPGTDSISSSMSFALLYVSTCRNVLKKIHAEFDAVIGRDRLPDPADRANMPHMSDVVNDTFRLSSIIPRDVLHSTIDETKVGVHHDEKYWGDPENFRPERFLNADGTLKKEERVIPCSIGKRVCVAEGLAQVQFFLFLTGVLQRFDFMESPNPYKLILRERA